MNKKIVAYIGSRRGEESNTYKFVKEILDVTKSKCNNIEYEIITANEVIIKPCNGCQMCFEMAKCAYDKFDDMYTLRSKLKTSDFVIFGSPVYAHHVSGDLKILFDRIAFWTHTMELHGKGSIVCSTTSSNGHKTAIDYMSNIVQYLGTNLVAKYNCAVEVPSQLHNKEWMDNTAQLISDKIIQYLKKPTESNNNLEKIFNARKEMMLISQENNISNGILDSWKDSGLLYCESYSEVLQKYSAKTIK